MPRTEVYLTPVEMIYRAVMRKDVPEGEDVLDPAKLNMALDTLPEREALVVRLRYGFSDTEDPPMTYKRIGEILGVSGPRSRQLLHVAIRRLRHPSRRVDILGWKSVPHWDLGGCQCEMCQQEAVAAI